MVSAEAIKARIPLASEVGKVVKLTKKGGEHLGLCPFHKEKTPSFTVNEGKGFYHCFGCGAHGDLFQFVMAWRNVDFKEAVRILSEEAGLSSEEDVRKAAAQQRQREQQRKREHQEGERRRIAFAQELWRERQRMIAGTPVAAYLAARGLQFDLRERPYPPTLGYLPECKYLEKDDPDNDTVWPAMIAPMQRFNPKDRQSPVVAVHRTYLARDGKDKAPVAKKKKMLGPSAGAAIRFAPARERLALAEGIETGLSVAQAFPDLAVWVAGSLGNMAGRGKGQGAPHPEREGKRLPSREPDMGHHGVILPPSVREVVLLADNDSEDPLFARGLIELAAARYTLEGRAVDIKTPPPGMDFNDLLLEGSPC